MVPTDEQIFISLMSGFGEYYYGDPNKRHLPFNTMKDIQLGDSVLEYLIKNGLLKTSEFHTQYAVWVHRWLNKVTHNLQIIESSGILEDIRYIFNLYIVDIETRSTIMHTGAYVAIRRKILKKIASILQDRMGPDFMDHKVVFEIQTLEHTVSVLDSILDGTILELHLGLKYLDECCVKYVQRSGTELMYREQCSEVAELAKELFDKYFV